MSKVEEKLAEMGLVLPAPIQLPPGMVLPFPWVRPHGNVVYISGHGPLNPDGSLAQPLGKVGADLTVEQGYHAAKLVGLAILASLKTAIGDLDRIDEWVQMFGMVNSAPGFNQQPSVINGFSELIVELYGERGRHARSAVGMAELPMNIPVEIEGTVTLKA
ncbi:MAG: RidA family protein [Anaerolineales bacterium]|nr:RidA family protein [Anaerolineales bacterium]